MKNVSTGVLTLFMVCGLALSSCGKKGNLERPPQKDKEEVSIIGTDNNQHRVI